MRVDYSPLLNPIAPERVRAYRDAARAAGTTWSRLPVTQLLALVLAVPIIAVALLITGIGFATVSLASGNLVLPIPSLLIVVVVIGLLVLAVVRLLGSRDRWERWARLDDFAARNGFRFLPIDGAPGYPGAIFQSGDSRHARERLIRFEGRTLDLGNYRYSTGSGKNRTTHTWGYLALRLDRRLPHMVLDSRANNGLFGSTNLPSAFARDQVLSLEGDFDRYFTLYCPAAYERDALYVFTPDLMALLIDEAAPFDVEIVDDWMFVYSGSEFAMADPATLQRLFRIVDTVGAKTLRQTDRYADERIGDRAVNLVAPQGARLKKGVPVAAVVTFVVVAAFWAWGFFGDFVS